MTRPAKMSRARSAASENRFHCWGASTSSNRSEGSAPIWTDSRATAGGIMPRIGTTYIVRPMTTASPTTPLDKLCIDAIRVLAMDGVQKANSGHPGTPMALAPIAYLLYTRVMNHSPADPQWPDRDRFVLSCGHASMLLYSLLYLAGYGLTLDDLKNFRQLGSPTAGHPEYRDAAGIETTTGPLGQGISNSVGLTLAERMWAARFNRGDHQI